jgi:hypothetical protein
MWVKSRPGCGSRSSPTSSHYAGTAARKGHTSTPIRWDELDAIHPDDLTIATVPGRLAAVGDPWQDYDQDRQSLEPLLALHRRDREAGLHDAPWPPVYPKQPDEPPRVAPSRAKKT